MEGSWGDSTRSHYQQLSAPNFSSLLAAPWAPPQPCWVCLLDSTLGVPTPPCGSGSEPALTMRPLGTPKCLGFPGIPPLITGPRHGGPPTTRIVEARIGELSRDGRQAVERARCAPAGLHILKHQLTTSFLCHRKCLYRNQTTERSKV